MPLSDMQFIFQWWGTLFLVGAAAFPLTKLLFRGWHDDGYLFTKAVGMAAVSFLVYVFGTLHILPFTQATVWMCLGMVFVFGVFLYLKSTKQKEIHKGKQGAIFFEELFFLAALVVWSWVKAHEPSIHNLEKFMDFGFTKSILDSRFFPAPDMWYAGATINYYYFGHTVMAVATRLSGIDLSYTFNLMLAAIFAWTLTMSFSIGRQLTKVIGGLLTAFLVTLAGNMQTIYAFTQGYDGDKVKPFWQLLWPLADIWQKLPQGMNRYWYANATRFIPYTIHEFPSYSFVVSDVHGHVLSLPFVLLAIALLIQIFTNKQLRSSLYHLIFYGFLCGVLLMTNALDGPIYFGLLVVVLLWVHKKNLAPVWKKIAIVLLAAAAASLPFLVHFKSFVSGIAVNCPPALLANLKIGPLLFEGVEKCQHSPLWMMWLLWGFFIYCGAFLLGTKGDQNKKLLAIFYIFSIALIIFPEFFYFKDIYPMHFRSNTMFKLGYQAFILFSIVSVYAIANVRKKVFFIFLIPQLLLVSIFPIFSVRSYFNSLKNYEGIYGLNWMAEEYPNDWAGINWLNQRVIGDRLSVNSNTDNRKQITDNVPVIVEADGDSYTDYARFSAFTGLPTIIGWPVHEWLWRGSYDIVAPRREEVRLVYESTSLAQTKQILAKYHVTYVIVGTLERRKFPNLLEWKFNDLGAVVFSQGETSIYKIR